MGAKFQPAPLVAGIGVIVVGVLALLDSQDVISLSFAALAPLACAVLGATLLASGLTRSG
jgi:hypothetical protein